MAITPISGLIDPPALESGADASGPKVAAELQQLINKENEVIVDVNSNSTAIVANKASADSGIAANTVNTGVNANAISALEITEADHETRIGDNETNIAANTSAIASLSVNYETLYTDADSGVSGVGDGVGFIYCTGTGSGLQYINLSLADGRELSIFNNRPGDIQIDGDSGGSETIGNGEVATVVGLDVGGGSTILVTLNKYPGY